MICQPMTAQRSEKNFARERESDGVHQIREHGWNQIHQVIYCSIKEDVLHDAINGCWRDKANYMPSVKFSLAQAYNANKLVCITSTYKAKTTWAKDYRYVKPNL